MSIIRSLFRLNSPRRMARIMLNKTSIVSSVFDERPSFQLSYRDYNTFYTNTMTDEVRKVNNKLFLGIGRLTIIFGKFNPMPFMMIGPPDPWVGPDIEYPDKWFREKRINSKANSNYHEHGFILLGGYRWEMFILLASVWRRSGSTWIKIGLTFL